MAIDSSHFGRLLRAGAIVGLLVLPGTVFWNLAAERVAPGLTLRVLDLTGVTDPAPTPQWTWPSFVHGTLRAAIARAIADASPLRPLLIRINNEIRYTAFGYISTPDIVEGDHGELAQYGPLSEYCSRESDTAERRARELIPRLRAIQAFFESRNRVFLYMITPSKVAHQPEYFVHRFPCPSSEQDRTMLLPRLDRLLREAGINVLDAASLIHGLKGTYETDLFARGGTHWNAVASARTADAIIAEVNRLAGRSLMPQLDWTYTMFDYARGADADLASLLNLLVTRSQFKSADVEFHRELPCDVQPENPLNIAFIGSSFSNGPALALMSGECLAHQFEYFYLSMSGFGGIPVRWRYDVNNDDLASIRDADVVIVEENEGFATQPGYIERLQALVSRPTADRDDINHNIARIGQVSTNWTVAASGDFDGDGKSDVLWHDTLGNVTIWLMNGTQVLNADAAFVRQLSHDWTIVGIGDFNGDGKGDVLLRDTSGDAAIWLMNGTRVLNPKASGIGQLSTDWTIVGTGDFNGDGKSDVLWRHTSGTVAIWLMNGTEFLNPETADVGYLSPDWAIVGTGDFNGDGTSDILLRDTSGNVAIWLVSGTDVLNPNAAGIKRPRLDWAIVGTGDFNGDGKSDILWRDTTGNLAIWLMNGTDVLNSDSSDVGQLSTDWRVVGIGDFNGDGKSDILLRDTRGNVAIWLMNGTQVLNPTAENVGNVPTIRTIRCPLGK